MEIAIGTGFFTKWDVDVNSGHAAKVRTSLANMMSLYVNNAIVQSYDL